ncbi:aKG-HExxH-type peptide beta-hydroxylase [Streptomyces sp. NPDC003362]
MSRFRKGGGEGADDDTDEPPRRSHPSVTASEAGAVAAGRDIGEVVTGDGNVTGRDNIVAERILYVRADKLLYVQGLPYEAVTPGPGPAASPAPLPPVDLPPRRVDEELIRGRDDLVAQVEQEVRRRLAGHDGDGGGSTWVLSGLGGCGKTTAALEIAHRLEPEMEHVWWVSEADGDLSGALHSVAFAAGADVGDFDRAHPSTVLWRQLNSLTVPWLLVLDNMDDPAALRAVIRRLRPKRPNGTVLVTSRNSRLTAWDPKARMLPVDVLDADDGAQVLIDLAPEAGEEPAARLLAERLGGLPLALYLAGSYLAADKQGVAADPDAPATFEAYRRTVHERLPEDVADPDGTQLDPDPDRRTIRTTWELSLRLLERQAEEVPQSRGKRFARPLLRLLSCFGLAPLPHRQLLSSEALAASPPFEDATEPEISAALSGLKELGLIRVEPFTADRPFTTDIRWVLTLHPLVREFNRAHGAEYLELAVALLGGATDPLDPGTPADWPLWRHWAPHCSAALHLPGLDGSGPELLHRATRFTVRAAEYRTYMGIYDEAVADLRAVAALRTSRLGPDHRHTLAGRLSLAWALRDNGDLSESVTEYRETIGRLARTLPDDDPLLPSARGGLARALRGLGGADNYAEAERELRTVLDVRRRDPEANALGLLRTRRDIATVLHRRGLWEEAADELRAVWQESRNLLGERHIDTLTIGTSLTRSLRDAGRTDEAEQITTQVMDGYGEGYTDDHPHVLVARHERARVLRDQGRYAAAEAEFTAIWRVEERRFGAEHPDTLASRHELGTVLHLLGRREEAAAHYRAVGDSLSRRLGDTHPDVATCRRNLALVLDELTDDGRTGTAQGAAPMIDGTHGTHGTDGTDGTDDRGEAVPDFADIRLRDALALADEDDPEILRILERFTRPRVSRGGGEPGGSGGMSWVDYSSPSPRGKAEPTYRPPAPPKEDPEQPPKPLPPSHGLTPAARRAATGRETRDLVDGLIRQERGLRKMTWARVAKAAMASPHLLHPRLPVEPAVELFLELEDTAPDVLDDLLLYPATGRWMAHVLRRLENPEDRAAVPVWVDLGHLNALAAAAAIKAGLDFTGPVPVRDGVVHLPTLGHAAAGAGRPETALVEVVAGQAVLKAGGGSIPIPQAPGGGPARWHTPHRTPARTAAASWAPVLDDSDPFRDADGPSAPDPLTPERAARWDALVQQAWRLLVRLDAPRAEAMGRAVTALTPRPPAGPGRTGMSLTSSDAFGGITLSEPRDATELAATLVHEFRHTQLTGVLHGVTLHTAGSFTEPGYAPWRDDPRPFPGLFQGVFAYLGVTEFWWLLSCASSGRERRRAQFELAYWGRETWDVFTALRSSPHLGEAGRTFMDELERTASPWRGETDIPEDVAALAVEAAAGQRARWRLHHLRVEADVPARLTRAWAAGGERPGVPRGFAALCPDPAARLLDTGLPLLREAAVDLAEFRRTHEAAGPQGADPDGQVADVARLLGDLPRARHLATRQIADSPLSPEPWVRLALAVRRDQRAPAAAARALIHRPELVRALYHRIRQTTGAAPDPVDVAEWVDGPADADLPPVQRPW